MVVVVVVVVEVVLGVVVVVAAAWTGTSGARRGSTSLKQADHLGGRTAKHAVIFWCWRFRVSSRVLVIVRREAPTSQVLGKGLDETAAAHDADEAPRCGTHFQHYLGLCWAMLTHLEPQTRKNGRSRKHCKTRDSAGVGGGAGLHSLLRRGEMPTARTRPWRAPWAPGRIVRASPGCRRPLFRRSVACVTKGVCVVPVVARLWREGGRSSLRRLQLGSASTMHGRGGLGCCRGSGLDRT